MTDDRLKQIDDKMIVGAVLLDFRATFDVIDHSLLLEKRRCYCATPTAIIWIKSYLSNRTQRAFLLRFSCGEGEPDQNAAWYS